MLHYHLPKYPKSNEHSSWFAMTFEKRAKQICDFNLQAYNFTKKDFVAGIFLWILWNVSEHLFQTTPPDDFSCKIYFLIWTLGYRALYYGIIEGAVYRCSTKVRRWRWRIKKRVLNGGVESKKGFLKISQNSSENTCTGVSFLIKLQA